MINSESDACEIFMRLIMVKNYQTPLNLEVLEELEKKQNKNNYYPIFQTCPKIIFNNFFEGGGIIFTKKIHHSNVLSSDYTILIS